MTPTNLGNISRSKLTIQTSTTDRGFPSLCTSARASLALAAVLARSSRHPVREEAARRVGRPAGGLDERSPHRGAERVRGQRVRVRDDEGTLTQACAQRVACSQRSGFATLLPPQQREGSGEGVAEPRHDGRHSVHEHDVRLVSGDLEVGGRACSGACGWSSMTRREAIC